MEQVRQLRERSKGTPLSEFAAGFAGDEPASVMDVTHPGARKAGQLADIISSVPGGIGKGLLGLGMGLGGAIQVIKPGTKAAAMYAKAMKEAEVIRSSGIARGAKDLDIASEQAAATGLHTSPAGDLVKNIPLSGEHINVAALRGMRPGEQVALRDILHPRTPYAKELPEQVLDRTLVQVRSPEHMGGEGIQGSANWIPVPETEKAFGNLWLNQSLLDKPHDLPRTFGHETTHIVNQAQNIPHGSSVSAMADVIHRFKEGRVGTARALVKGEPLTPAQAQIYADYPAYIERLAKKLEKDPGMIGASEFAARRDPVKEYLRVNTEGEARAGGALSMFDPKVQRMIPATQDPFMTGMQSTGHQLADVPAYMKPSMVDRVVDPNSWIKSSDWEDFAKRFR